MTSRAEPSSTLLEAQIRSPSIPSSFFIPAWISASSFASSARISFGARCSTSFVNHFLVAVRG